MRSGTFVGLAALVWLLFRRMESIETKPSFVRLININRQVGLPNPKTAGSALNTCQMRQCRASGFVPVRNLQIQVRFPTATYMNGWFLSRAATPTMMQLRQFFCCERTQRENRIHRLGSLRPYSAGCLNVGLALRAIYATVKNLLRPFPYLSFKNLYRFLPKHPDGNRSPLVPGFPKLHNHINH